MEIQDIGGGVGAYNTMRAMDRNALDDATGHHEFEGGDDSQHILYITWPGQNANDDQRPVL